MKIRSCLILLIILLPSKFLSRAELKKLSDMIAANHQTNGKITPGGLAWKKLREYVIERPEMDTISKLKTDTVLFMNGYRFMNREYIGEVVAGGHHLSFDYSKVTKKYDVHPYRILSTTQVDLLMHWDIAAIHRKEADPHNFIAEDGNMNIFVFVKKGKTWTLRKTPLKNYYDQREYKMQ